MPFLLIKEVEFSVTAVDGKPVDQATAGRFRVVAEEGEKESYKMFVKPCDENEWKEARSEDVDFLKKVLERYA